MGAGYAGLSDCFAHFGFVAVELGGVDMSVAGAESGEA